MRFDIPTQRCVCGHCMNSFDPQQLNDNISEDAKTENCFETFVYSCPNCGAELMTTDKNDAVGFCPYCGGASMIYDKMRKEWLPESIIPFKITKEDCKKAYVREVRRHPFVSRKFRNPKLIEGFRGIYMPYWDYEEHVKGECAVKADGEEKYVGHNDYVTDHYEARFDADAVISGFSHDASVSFDDHLSEKLAPYDHSGKQPFHPAYLDGFYAESGDSDARNYTELADSTLSDYLEDELALELEKQTENSRMTLDMEESTLPRKVKVCERGMYPVWFMSYRRGKKITYAAVNGQTGKVAADLPLSPLRILLAALGIGAALFGLILLFMQLLPSIKGKTMLGISIAVSLFGVYVLQHSLLQSVGNAVRNEKIFWPKSLRNPDFNIGNLSLTAIGAFALTIVGVIAYTSDSSYEHFWGTVGGIAAIIGAVFLVWKSLNQSSYLGRLKVLQIKSESKLRQAIVSDSKRFLKINTFIKLALFILIALGVGLFLLDLPKLSVYYIYCVVISAGLFAYSAVEIAFQAKLGERELPQFKKKGALYDEN